MGTRSITRIYDVDGQQLVQIYRQFDGYFDGHGRELGKILEGLVVVNGITGEEPGSIANGMGCLAAQVVSALKGRILNNEPRALYLQAPSMDEEEYQYEIRLPENEGHKLFDVFGPRVQVKPLILGYSRYERFLGTAEEWVLGMWPKGV